MRHINEVINGTMKILKAFFKIISVLSMVIAIPSMYYAFKYMNWLAKSQGYPEIYQKEEYYDFEPAPSHLSNSNQWKIIARDIENDGDIPNRSDTKTLSQLKLNDTLWFKYELYNNLDINHPMVSLALDIDENSANGMNWYGTEGDFRYDLIIAVGYIRVGNRYKGYNYIDKKIGACKMNYIFETNSLLLGIPIKQIEHLKHSKFIASAGNMGLWNDDYEGRHILNWNE